MLAWILQLSNDVLAQHFAVLKHDLEQKQITDDELSARQFHHMKTALVHDYLAQAGGAERVAAAFHVLFPDAPFVHVGVRQGRDPAKLCRDGHSDLVLAEVAVSSRRFHKLALSCYPAAFERFDFTGYDFVLSSSSSFAKGIFTPPETCHVCYCHTPSRFIWRQQEYLSSAPSARRLHLSALMSTPCARGTLKVPSALITLSRTPTMSPGAYGSFTGAMSPP